MHSATTSWPPKILKLLQERIKPGEHVQDGSAREGGTFDAHLADESRGIPKLASGRSLVGTLRNGAEDVSVFQEAECA
jgi:hypothetical protein